MSCIHRVGLPLYQGYLCERIGHGVIHPGVRHTYDHDLLDRSGLAGGFDAVAIVHAEFGEKNLRIGSEWAPER